MNKVKFKQRPALAFESFRFEDSKLQEAMLFVGNKIQLDLNTRSYVLTTQDNKKEIIEDGDFIVKNSENQIGVLKPSFYEMFFQPTNQ